VRILLAWLSAAVAPLALAQSDPAAEYSSRIRPALAEHCSACHNPAAAKGPAPFLKAAAVTDMQNDRGLWRRVAAQLRNRTMPPRDSKLAEADRLHIASWIDARLRDTACDASDYAGPAVTRRLNRREYHNTIRDLLGVDFEVTAILPADGTGGAGFDTNGETLYIAPVLLERYMEAARQILDRVVVTPAVNRTFDLSGPASLAIYIDGAYDIAVAYESPSETEVRLAFLVDGAEVGMLNNIRRRINNGKPVTGPAVARLQVNLSRGTHVLSIAPKASEAGLKLVRLTVTQKVDPPSPEMRALHYRLFGIEPGERPGEPRRAARILLEEFVAKAFRRPVEPAEVDRFLALYDRSAERGDPYEERVKLALRAVLVWPDFLFRIERKRSEPGIYPLSGYELASRLSYFLWSTAPDDKLRRAAEAGELQEPGALRRQVDRMLDDPRSRKFTTSFVGQWLGTQDVGGRVVPLLTELQSFYTPQTAADLRAQPVLLMERLLRENRSLLDLLQADYTYLNGRLARFYQVENKVPGLSEDEFKLVQWPDDRRAGLLGMGAVLAMTSRYKQTSPVLRGAWVLDTLLGTPVPPPPPDVPELKDDGAAVKLSMRERVAAHRANPACAACHRMMDPIGFGLENFDWMGRWRDADDNGAAIDASGELPSGEKFRTAQELRARLSRNKGEFVRNVTARVLGYALGRSLQDGDDCTVHRIVQKLEGDGYRARTLIHEIALSLPFRNSQGGAVVAEPVSTNRPLNISGLNARKQDAASHNNLVKTPPKNPR
jgi:cytochrome c553